MTGNNLSIVLQDRDRLLLRELRQFRIVDREQTQILCGFNSITRANTRLLALTRAGLLNRCFIATLAGGKKSLYFLSRKGASLIGSAGPVLQRQKDTLLVGDRFVNHQLKINALILIIKCSPGLKGSIRCLGWLSFKKPLSASCGLIPDGYFELAIHDRTISSFLEVDLGTESLPVWKKKVEGYLGYALSGAFETQFRRAQFRVLIVTDTERRLRSLRGLIAKHTDKIFWLSSFDLIENRSFWDAVWFRPGMAEPQLLIGGAA